MYKIIYHIHYRPGFKMGKPDDLPRRSGAEKPAMDAHFFDKEQLLDLENDDVGEEEDAEDVELQGMVTATWEKKNGQWVVPQEHKLHAL